MPTIRGDVQLWQLLMMTKVTDGESRPQRSWHCRSLTLNSELKPIWEFWMLVEASNTWRHLLRKSSKSSKMLEGSKVDRRCKGCLAIEMVSGRHWWHPTRDAKSMARKNFEFSLVFFFFSFFFLVLSDFFLSKLKLKLKWTRNRDGSKVTNLT